MGQMSRIDEKRLAASSGSPSVGRRSMSFSVRAALEQFTLPHPSGPHPPGSHPSGPHPSGQGRLTIRVAPPAGAISESGGPAGGVPVLYVVDGEQTGEGARRESGWN